MSKQNIEDQTEGIYAKPSEVMARKDWNKVKPIKQEGPFEILAWAGTEETQTGRSGDVTSGFYIWVRCTLCGVVKYRPKWWPAEEQKDDYGNKWQRADCGCDKGVKDVIEKRGPGRPRTRLEVGAVVAARTAGGNGAESGGVELAELPRLGRPPEVESGRAVSVYLPDSLHMWAKRLAFENRTTFSKLVQELLAGYKRQLEKQSASGHVEGG